MKIKFLGTSAGWPLPRLGCKCEICTSKDPKDTRTRTQVLIDNRILLDAGPDTYFHLKNQDLTKLEAVFISHEHPDHTFGLWDLPHIYGRSETGLNKIQLFITEPVLKGINKVFSHPHKLINLNVVKENVAVNMGDLKISYIPVIHGNTPAYAIKCQNSKIFTYITDFSEIPSGSQDKIKNSNLVAFDGSSLGKTGQGPGHISINDGIEIGKNLKAGQIYFIHIGHKTDTHKHLETYLKEKAGPNYHVAFDGLEIKL